jgi:hypothetical protein
MASTELGLGLGSQTATDPQAQTKYMLAVAKGNIKRGASWFDWIAALSVVNAVLATMGGWVFLAGLGITTRAFRFGAARGNSGLAIGFIVTLIAAGVFFLLGYFAKQGQQWALVLGISVYALDAVLLLADAPQAWLMIAFHAYALFMIAKTFPAIKLYEQARERAAAQGIQV